MSKRPGQGETDGKPAPRRPGGGQPPRLRRAGARAAAVRARPSRVRGRGNQIRAQARPDSSVEQITVMAPGVSSGPAHWSSRRTVVRSRRPPTSSSTLSVLACTRDDDGWKPLRDSVITNTTDFDSQNRCYQHRPTWGPWATSTKSTLAPTTRANLRHSDVMSTADRICHPRRKRANRLPTQRFPRQL
jgi:hypothetical protein